MKKQVYAAVLAFVLGSCLVTLDAQGSFWTLINGRLQTRNPVGFATGTAAAPSITFANGGTSGAFLKSGGIAFTNGGTEVAGILGSTVQLTSGSSLGWSSGAVGSATDTALSRVAAGEFGWTAVLFSALGTPANGTFCYCSDCTIASPCASGGTGALAKRLNGVWVCN